MTNTRQIRKTNPRRRIRRKTMRPRYTKRKSESTRASPAPTQMPAHPSTQTERPIPNIPAIAPTGTNKTRSTAPPAASPVVANLDQTTATSLQSGKSIASVAGNPPLAPTTAGHPSTKSTRSSLQIIAAISLIAPLTSKTTAQPSTNVLRATMTSSSLGGLLCTVRSD